MLIPVYFSILVLMAIAEICSSAEKPPYVPTKHANNHAGNGSKSSPPQDKSIGRTLAKIHKHEERGRIILLTCKGKCPRERVDVSDGGF